MPWFGLSNDDDYDDDDDYEEEEGERILDDLETGGFKSLGSMPTVNHSSTSSNSSEETQAEIAEKVSFRPLRAADRWKIQKLHEEWFPVTYSDEFYDELVTHQRLATSGDNLFTCVATLDQRNNNLYCQPAGEGSRPKPRQQQQQQDDEIIGCLVGAFLHPSRLNQETAELLVPNPQVHSKLFYIMTLGTVEEYRNLGLATMLVQQAMDLIEQERECGALYLHVIPFNHAAIRFYEKLGFYRVCKIDNYYNIDNKHYDCFLYARYFHGNRGHRTLYKLVTGAISSIWQHIKSPLSMFSVANE